jgi:hypothetical protein
MLRRTGRLRFCSGYTLILGTTTRAHDLASKVCKEPAGALLRINGKEAKMQMPELTDHVKSRAGGVQVREDISGRRACRCRRTRD